MQQRRTFIKTIGRGIVLSGLIGLSGVLLFREKPEGAETCDFDFICKNCKKNTSCQLPEAKAYKDNKTPKS